MADTYRTKHLDNTQMTYVISRLHIKHAVERVGEAGYLSSGTYRLSECTPLCEACSAESAYSLYHMPSTDTIHWDHTQMT